ncbi:ABC transporter permease [Rhabdaerophilum calidifontis]|uniref:ABC transporter permease n=1 Tax=Rhabdaerophilum calidifontis TaxID=2604328 RepID=UPI00123A8238|nr:MlaE family lipid ABC transporter permease subunit [Rhabdaerophilum calidifontis]
MAIPAAAWQGGERTGGRLALTGSWNAEHAAALEGVVAAALAKSTTAGPVAIECSALVGFDTLGAYLIHKLATGLGSGGHPVEIVGLTPAQRILLDEVSVTIRQPEARSELGNAYRILSDIGEGVVDAGRDVAGGVSFFGSVVIALGRLFTGRTRLRFPAVVAQLERVGLRSVPIIVLISFLVGAIISQQSVFQLRPYGTVQFVADLIGILSLRELAVLLTSIMIAGRSGSSFTAELGSMKMREEVDALETMGMDPIEVLVLPRLLALIIAMPLLTFLSAMASIGGGALVAMVYGGVSADVFFSRLQNAIALNTFLVGMIKAPFMALVIGITACIEGFAVRGSAESLGTHTTASVVKSIFMVIVVDGLFAMFFAAIDY